jgi:hypothetical protein
MRRNLIAPVVVALAFGGCGGNDLTTTVTKPFPPVHEQAGGAYTTVKNQLAAERLCFRAQASWPDAYAAYDRVTFRVPGPFRNYVCKRPH